jgi:hypothetical protein
VSCEEEGYGEEDGRVYAIFFVEDVGEARGWSLWETIGSGVLGYERTKFRRRVELRWRVRR